MKDNLTHAPGWVNVVIMGSSWAVSFLQPIALVVTIVWGILQIWGWLEKRLRS